ncbi:hypothetical protein FB45DRAFT_902243 [Roridomyces roridus]|uniref:MYND-type domain-containing protein n=1 Tax=Roridomyces roridus TaxID=1738132 RepID=A0AAD7C3C7_9AGAR|nr:hypothetical protein FB45DRAFT_902243 [Roridomyces roridus]
MSPDKKRTRDLTPRATNETTFPQLLAVAHWSETPETSDRVSTARLDQLLKDITRALRIPEVWNVRGLKQCHQAFAAVSSALDEVATQCLQHSGDRFLAERVAAGIVVVYACMGEDISLRSRIFSESRFLENAAPLLSSPDVESREIVLKTLNNLTRLHDSAILRKITRFLPNILKCAEDNVVELGSECQEHALYVLIRSTTAVFDDATPDPELVALVPRILRFALDMVRLLTSSLVVNQLVYFCRLMSRSPAARHLFISAPDWIDFLVAGTRAQELATRCLAQCALVELYSTSGPTGLQKGTAKAQPVELLQPGSGTFLVDAKAALDELTDLTDNKSARSLSELGRAFGELIQRDPLVVRMHLARPGSKIPVLLRLCEFATRKAGSGIAADIIHMELLFSVAKEAAHKYARVCIDKHPSVAYFYYITTIHPEAHEIVPSVRLAVEGLKQPVISAFIRRELCCCVANFTYEVLMGILRGDPQDADEPKLSFLTQATALHTGTFLDIAQPDNPRLPEISALAIHVDFLANGHTLTDEELETAAKRFSSICEMARSTRYSFRLSKECLALEHIFPRMSTAWKRWESIMTRQPERKVASRITEANPSADPFVEWLDRLCETEMEMLPFEVRGLTPGKERYGMAQLRRCSKCDTPNAALRRCAGCQMARYCDNTCQKAHWKIHRKACKASRANSDASSNQVGTS